MWGGGEDRRQTCRELYLKVTTRSFLPKQVRCPWCRLCRQTASGLEEPRRTSLSSCSIRCRNWAKERAQVVGVTGTMFVMSSHVLQYFHIISLSLPSATVGASLLRPIF